MSIALPIATMPHTAIRGAMRTYLSILLLLAACEAPPPPPGPSEGTFPSVERPVANIISSEFSDEADRERVGEAAEVMDLMQIDPGDVVADIGAGNGYYTMKLAARVEASGRVFAEDIMPDTTARLKKRVASARLDNVVVVLGTPDNPGLPARSLDHALLVHMYHEIENPYALLWHLRTSLKPGATVGIIDADRPTRDHGTPSWLLACEVGAIGFSQYAFHQLGDGKSYLSIFKATQPRPKPLDIQPCRSAP